MTRGAPLDPRSRVLRFLASRAEGATAAEIASEVLRVTGMPERAIEAVVRGLLAGEPRVIEGTGRWRLAASGAGARGASGDVGAGASIPVPPTSEPDPGDFIAVAGSADPRAAVAVTRFRAGRAVATAVLRASLPIDARSLALIAEPPAPLLVAFDARSLRLARALARGAEPILLRDLARAARGRAPRTIEALAQDLRVRWPADDAEPGAYSEAVARLYLALREVAGRATAGFGSEAPHRAAALDRATQPDRAAALDRLLPAEMRARLPTAPGVYLFRAQNGRPLYVGKALNLRRRLLSHFTAAAVAREAAAALHEASARVTFEVVGSEVGALLREFELIARHRPRFNVQRLVHRGAGRAPRDAIVLLPTPAPSRALVCAMRADGLLVTREVERTRRSDRTLAGIVALFADSRIASPAPRASRAARFPAGYRRLGAEGLAILDAWVRQNRDAVTVVEPRRFGTPRELAAVLRDHLADRELFAGRVVRYPRVLNY
jgi:hypothetical protein